MANLPKAATSYMISSCEHGTVFITLLDENGDGFAEACITAEQAGAAGEHLKKISDEILAEHARKAGGLQ